MFSNTVALQLPKWWKRVQEKKWEKRAKDWDAIRVWEKNGMREKKGFKERGLRKQNEREWGKQTEWERKKMSLKMCYVARSGWPGCVVLIGESFSTFGIKCFLFFFQNFVERTHV